MIQYPRAIRAWYSYTKSVNLRWVYYRPAIIEFSNVNVTFASVKPTGFSPRFYQMQVRRIESVFAGICKKLHLSCYLICIVILIWFHL